MKNRVKVRDAGGRLARSALVGSLAGLGCALLDAGFADRWYARDPQAVGPSPSLDILADAGCVAPFALLLGLVAGVAALAIDPARAPSPSSFIAALRLRAVGRPADVAAFVPLAVLAAFFWMTLTAHVARAILGLDAAPTLVGVAMAASSLGIGLFAATMALTLTPPLRRALATASEGRPICVDPAWTGGVAVGVAALLFAFGVATGGLSGEGGLFGIYGVFKRPELDLRAPTLVLVIAVSAFFAPAFLARPRGSVAVGLALLPLALTARAASAMNVEVDTTQRLERGAPLAHLCMTALRRLTDRDHDGSSGSFGGGDCNDHDPRINPFAEDIPDNGIDEDCSGQDLTKRAIAVATPAPAIVPSAQAAVGAAIPADLNIVLITVDTLRTDLGFLGYDKPTSPNLDRLAARATVFEHAYSLASYTGKSVGPLLIGKYGSETHRNWGHFNKFSEEDTFVTERLKRAGFHTMSVQGHGYFGKFGGLDRGFDVLDMSAAPPEGTPWDVDNVSTSEKLSDAALKLLASAEHTDKRFFLWIHYLDPHADYLKHADVPNFGNDQRGFYDGEIAFTDKHIGRVLDAVAAAPWGGRTAIVMTSDHGEAFGEHKMFRHGFELWEELVHVPLIVLVPGAKPSRVSVRRSAIDVVPTLLEIAKVPLPPPPAEGASDFLSGTSLLPDVFLAPGAVPAARDVLIDMPGGPYNDPRRALIHDGKKLTISNGAQFELYDLDADPDERKNLWATGDRSIESVYAAAKAGLHEIRVTGQRK